MVSYYHFHSTLTQGGSVKLWAYRIMSFFLEDGGGGEGAYHQRIESL